eukprot:5459677-Alexandrium_andersonii.AAC.1
MALRACACACKRTCVGHGEYLQDCLRANFPSSMEVQVRFPKVVGCVGPCGQSGKGEEFRRQ